MSRRTAKLLVLAVLGLALSIVAYFVPVLDWIATAQAEIETFGAWSPVLYVVLYIILTLCLVPGSAMTFTAGLLYGLERGTMISLSAATIAAVAAFVTGRYLARERIAKLVARSPRFRALDRAVEKDAWKIVLLMRLSPAFPYVLLNYAFGMTRVSLPVFTLATLIGMIPATLFLTSAAAALGEAADGARREMAQAGTSAPRALTEPRELQPGEFAASLTWLRNRQLMLWRESGHEEALEQRQIAEFARALDGRVGKGMAAPPLREGESPEAALSRVRKALDRAAAKADEAAQLLAENRVGTARDRQKAAAESFLVARGDRRAINWGLWTAIGASLLVSLAVGRIATRALRNSGTESAGGTDGPAGSPENPEGG